MLQVEAEEAAAGMAPLLPVIVFLHGGGNTEGAGSRYDMAQVAERGFIAITVRRPPAVAFDSIHDTARG